MRYTNRRLTLPFGTEKWRMQPESGSVENGCQTNVYASFSLFLLYTSNRPYAAEELNMLLMSCIARTNLYGKVVLL